MSRLATIALALFALGASADPVRFETPIDCGDPAAVNEALFFSPWPAARVAVRGGSTRVAISPRGSATEGEILRYFAAVDRALPRVETEIRHDDHSIDSFVRIRRSWAYSHLLIAGQVTERGAIYYERIALETDEYPLVCELGIGQPIAELRRSLAAPVPHEAAGVAGVAVFRRPAGEVGSADYTIQASYDPSGRITRLEWTLPLAH